jgi:hypothetical protein
VWNFAVYGGALIAIILTPFYVGSAIGKVALFTGYLKPMLGLLVVLLGAALSSYLLRDAHDLLARWYVPLLVLFAYAYLLEFVEAVKLEKKEKEERLSALPTKKGYYRARPRTIGDSYGRVTTSSSKHLIETTLPSVKTRDNHGHIEERLRILLNHPIILIISFLASVLGILGFVMQFFLHL